MNKPFKGFLVSIFGFVTLFAFIIKGVFVKRPVASESKDKLLIIVPTDYKIFEPNFNGGAKDIQSTLEQIKQLDIPFQVVPVSRRISHAIYFLLKERGTFDLFLFDSVLISIPGASGSLPLYLRLLGFKNIHFRSHNAEFFHRKDWLKAATSFSGKLKASKKLISGTFSDFLVSVSSQSILSVSEFEIDAYWKVFFPWCSKKVFYFPGYSPSHIANSYRNSTITPRRRFATVIGSFQEGTIISLPDSSFIFYGEKVREFVHRQGLELASVGFSVPLTFCDVNLGRIDDIDEIIADSEVIIIPTLYGWGFKTKVSDAAAMHQSILMGETQYARYGEWRTLITSISNWAGIESVELKVITDSAYNEFLSNVMSVRKGVLRMISTQ